MAEGGASNDHGNMFGLIGALALFIVVTICSPGAANLLAAASGAQFGVRASAPLIAGISTSVLFVVALAGFGVGAVVASAPALQLVLRLVGTAYLLWLAMQIARAGRPDLGHGPSSPPGFLTGVALTLINPKTWAVGLSAAAGYSQIAPNALALAVVLVLAFGVIVVPNLLLWCRGGQVLARVLSTDRQWRILYRSMAVLLALSVIPIWLE